MDALATFARCSVVSFAKSPKFNKGCAKGVSFRLIFCDDFFGGAFFLHLILILIDPDFNEQQQQQKTLTEEKNTLMRLLRKDDRVVVVFERVEKGDFFLSFSRARADFSSHLYLSIYLSIYLYT